MKNWILTHKLLTIILACVIGAGAVCAVVLPITLRHEHKFSAEWTTDENYHWHECVGKKCKKVSDKAAHVFDKEEASETYLASAATYTDAARYYKSCICGVKGTETFSHGSSLSAKENVVGLKDGVTLGKTYDGEAYTLSEEQISRNGNGAITFTYKLKDSEAEFAEAAPENAGEYTVKVSVAATAEWKAATKTFDFAITPMVIGVDWEHPYDNSNVISGEPAELLAGDEATITVTMSSANVGAAVQDFEITGKDAGNYSLAREDVNVAIIKADINFKISNAAAFEKGFYVGATNIPDPTTNYVEIGDGYGDVDYRWQIHNGDGVWSPALPKSMVREKPGEWRVCIQYEDGINYNFGKTDYVYFTVKAKPRRIRVKNFTGKTYDGNQVTNFTFDNLVSKFSATTYDGVENITSATDSGEKYVEYRKKGDTLWTTVTDIYIPKNAAEYEYRIGVTATDEWEAVVSEVNTFTIKPYEFVLELGYVENQHNQSYDRGKTFKLRTFSKANGNELIAGQVIELWLNNEKAGFNTKEGNSSVFYFTTDQKKKVTTACFFLKISNFVSANMENYKIVTKYPNVTTVEITVVEKLTTGKSTSGPIQVVQPTEKKIYATVEKGYFQVGQTVILYNSAGTKVGEATITEISARGTTSASGCAIPSDGRVIIVLDKIFNDILSGKIVAK